MNESPATPETGIEAAPSPETESPSESASESASESGSGSEVPAIEVRHLSRWFPGVHAVRDVSFTVAKGRVVGFVGANGAGKTTTMRILATLDYPSSGEARVCGYNVVTHPAEVRRRIGWMPDHYGTYSHMTVLEYLDFFARALGYKGDERIERIAEVMEFTDLTGLADRLIDQLSKGMGQRLCLGRALLHDPEVLILDEPAAGLDPKARVELKHLIRVLAEEGKTVFISSHILSELGEMCDSLLFINQGRIIHHGSSESLRRGNAGNSVVEVQLAHSVERLAEWASLAPNVTFREATRTGGRIEIDSVEPGVVATVLRRMVEDGLPVVDFHLQERKLEDAFIEILGELEAGGTPIAG